jgi:hypothetical protein
MSDDQSDFLLNAPDGIARYEAHNELKRRDPAEVVPRLRKMLDEDRAKYPQEIKDLLDEIESGTAKARLAPEEPSARPIREQTPEDNIRHLVSYVGIPAAPNAPSIPYANKELLKIGAPAVPFLVESLYNPDAKKRRFGILQLLGEMAGQGVTEAREALDAACQADEPNIARPAQVVRQKLDVRE